jgi:hypothetical protein
MITVAAPLIVRTGELDRVFPLLRVGQTDAARAAYLGMSRAWYTKIKNGKVAAGPEVVGKIMTRLGPYTTFDDLFEVAPPLP